MWYTERRYKLKQSLPSQLQNAGSNPVYIWFSHSSLLHQSSDRLSHSLQCLTKSIRVLNVANQSLLRRLAHFVHRRAESSPVRLHTVRLKPSLLILSDVYPLIYARLHHWRQMLWGGSTIRDTILWELRWKWKVLVSPADLMERWSPRCFCQDCPLLYWWTIIQDLRSIYSIQVEGISLAKCIPNHVVLGLISVELWYHAGSVHLSSGVD